MKKKVIYILYDGKDRHVFDKEIDLLNTIEIIKQSLIDNFINNIIFCITKDGIEKKGTRQYKLYTLVNETYDTKEETIKKVKDYAKKGFLAFSIL